MRGRPGMRRLPVFHRREVPAIRTAVRLRQEVVVKDQDAEFLDLVERLADEAVVDEQVAVEDGQPFSRQAGDALDEDLAEHAKDDDFPAPRPAKKKGALVDEDMVAGRLRDL